MRKWLSTFVSTGSNVSSLLGLLTMSWGAVMAALIAILAYISGYATKLIHDSAIHDAGTLFIFLLWSWVGITILARGSRPILTRQVARLEHGLAYEGMGIAHDPYQTGDDIMQIGIDLRNYSGVAVSYEVERFDITIKTRHVSSALNTNRTGTIPFGAARCYWAPAYPRNELRDFLSKTVDANVELLITYKPYNEERKRRLSMTFVLGLTFGDVGIIGINDRIIDQKEEDA